MKKKIIAIALLATMTLSIGAVTLTGCGSSDSESSTAPSSSETTEAIDRADPFDDIEITVPDTWSAYTASDGTYVSESLLEDYAVTIGMYFSDGEKLSKDLLSETEEEIKNAAEKDFSGWKKTMIGNRKAYEITYFGTVVGTVGESVFGNNYVRITAFNIADGIFTGIAYAEDKSALKNADAIFETVTESEAWLNEKAALEEQAAALKQGAKEQAAADKVSKRIAALDLGFVTDKNAGDIISAHKAYDKLTDSEKQRVEGYNSTFEEAYGTACVITGAKEYDFNTIARSPEKYKGEYIKVTGAVRFPIERGNNYEIQLATDTYQYIEGYGYGDAYMVYYTRADDEDRILTNDIVTVYGVIDGLEEGMAQNYPKIEAKYIQNHGQE